MSNDNEWQALKLVDNLVQNHGTYSVYADSFRAVVVDGEQRIIKRFKGETAWSDAERYASDRAWEEVYG